MGNVEYDVYINKKKSANPIYDERWNADSVYGDNVEARADGVVTVWDCANGMGNTNLINFAKNYFSRNAIDRLSSTDDISEALQISFRVGGDGPIAGGSLHPGKVRRTSVPFYRKGNLFSFADLPFQSEGRFYRALKFDTEFYSVGKLPEDTKETTGVISDWHWYGDGDGFHLTLRNTRPKTYEYDGKTYRVLGGYDSKWSYKIRTGDLRNTYFIIAPVQRNTAGEILPYYAIAAVYPAQIELDDGSFFNNSFSINEVHDADSLNLSGGELPQHNEATLNLSQNHPVDLVVNDVNYRCAAHLTSAGYGDGAPATAPLGNYLYLPEAAGKPLNGVDDTVIDGSVIKLFGNPEEPFADTGELVDALVEMLTNTPPEEWTFEERDDSAYHGDVVIWTGSDEDLFDAPSREYECTKLTNGTADVIRLHFMDDGDLPPTDSDDYYSTPDPGDPTLGGNLPENTGSGYLTTTYTIGDANLRLFGQFIWSDGYQPLTKNSSPIENIVSLVNLPLSITGGETDTIAVGASDSGVSGEKHHSIIKKYSAGPVTLLRAYNNFFDFEPYTKVSIYIPFIGFRELSPTQIYGKVLSIEFNVDITDGSLAAEVWRGVGSDRQLLDIYYGNCAIGLPLTSTNAQEKRSNAIQGAISITGSGISAAMNAATGNIGGTIGGVVSIASGVASLAMQKTHYTTKGSLGGGICFGNPMMPFLVVDKPLFTIPAGYGHQHGFRCDKTTYLSQASGYTVVDDLVLNGVPCTDEEAGMIKELLQAGVYF